jgi:hypothetical protein
MITTKAFSGKEFRITELAKPSKQSFETRYQPPMSILGIYYPDGCEGINQL